MKEKIHSTKHMKSLQSGFLWILYSMTVSFLDSFTSTESKIFKTLRICFFLSWGFSGVLKVLNFKFTNLQILNLAQRKNLKICDVSSFVKWRIHILQTKNHFSSVEAKNAFRQFFSELHRKSVKVLALLMAA